MPYPDDVIQAAHGNYVGGVQNVNEYVFHPGVCVLPLAEDPPTDPTELAVWSPVVILKLHAPYRERRFTQVSGKSMNPSPVAAPGDTGSFVFTGGQVTVTPHQNASYSNFDWITNCAYTYVENCTSRDESGKELGLILGTLPFSIVMDRQNAGQYGYSPPLLGAVAQGGRAATTGYRMGLSIIANENGQLRDSWGYNAQAFFPGELFYSDLPNGGKPVTQGG